MLDSNIMAALFRTRPSKDIPAGILSHSSERISLTSAADYNLIYGRTEAGCPHPARPRFRSWLRRRQNPSGNNTAFSKQFKTNSSPLRDRRSFAPTSSTSALTACRTTCRKCVACCQHNFNHSRAMSSDANELVRRF